MGVFDSQEPHSCFFLKELCASLRAQWKCWPLTYDICFSKGDPNGVTMQSTKSKRMASSA